MKLRRPPLRRPPLRRPPLRRPPPRGNPSAPASDKVNLDALAAMFGIPAWDDLRERNADSIGEAYGYAYNDAKSRGWSEGKADLAAQKAEWEAEGELYRQWRNALLGAVEPEFEKHLLELVPVGRHKIPYEFRVVPTKGWREAASKIIGTLNGVGEFAFGSLRDFLASGPYSAREAVLRHIHWIPSRAGVYGYRSAERSYYHAMR